MSVDRLQEKCNDSAT
uniref:Uncharacterized protein n=1 Tax=Anguilla anguilla TaxID=7936 RepID=A0A0E9UX42_ANGAN